MSSVFLILSICLFIGIFYRVAVLQVIDGRLDYKVYHVWGRTLLHHINIPVGSINEVMVRVQLIVSAPRGKDTAYFIQLVTPQKEINIGQIIFRRRKNALHFQSRLKQALMCPKSSFYYLTFVDWAPILGASIGCLVCWVLSLIQGL